MELNTSISQYACHPLASDVEMCNFVGPTVDISPKVGVFCGRIAPKPYVPHQNSLTKRKAHPWGVDCIYRPRNDSYCPKLWRLSCSLRTNTLEGTKILALLGTCKMPCAEIRKFSPVYACKFISNVIFFASSSHSVLSENCNLET